MFSGDVDIDLKTDFDPTSLFPWTRASLVKDLELRRHPCGIYPQNIPKDPITGFSAIPYEEAEKLGYMKIDFLHLSVYSHFKSQLEINELLKLEPDWKLLTIPDEQKKLFQLSNHGDILTLIKPRSIEELADVLALIRPGKKQYVKLYLNQREAVRKILYSKGEDGYAFKKAHAVSYAMVITLQLHLISAGLI